MATLTTYDYSSAEFAMRLYNACVDGKSNSSSGLNVNEIKDYLRFKGILVISGNRPQLQEYVISKGLVNPTRPPSSKPEPKPEVVIKLPKPIQAEPKPILKPFKQSVPDAEMELVDKLKKLEVVPKQLYDHATITLETRNYLDRFLYIYNYMLKETKGDDYKFIRYFCENLNKPDAQYKQSLASLFSKYYNNIKHYHEKYTQPNVQKNTAIENMYNSYEALNHIIEVTCAIVNGLTYSKQKPTVNDLAKFKETLIIFSHMATSSIRTTDEAFKFQ